VPEIGTIVAMRRPFVLLTSNNTREMSDALKRRCLHLYIPYPDADLERRIVAVRVPGIEIALRDQLVAFIQRIRRVDLKKHPSVSETVDWAKVLVLLHANALEESMVRETLSVFLKFEEDIRRVEQEVTTLLHDARAEMMG
jgi:MoxR-like ATPase